MSAIPNYAKERLRKGELALGFGVSSSRSVAIAKMAKVSGFDWLFIDMEHAAFGMDQATQICLAALDAGVTPIVRASGHEHFHASRVLDNGAMGVVVPHVSTVKEAKRVVTQTKFPPIGHRSVGGAAAQLSYAKMPVGELTKTLNETLLTVVMIESPEGVKNCERIAALKGVDVLLIGTNDMCAEMGIPGQFGHKRVEDAYRKVIAACRKHGKWAGMGGVYDQEIASRYINMGAQFLLSGSDTNFIMQAASARANFLRGLQKKK